MFIKDELMSIYILWVLIFRHEILPLFTPIYVPFHIFSMLRYIHHGSLNFVQLYNAAISNYLGVFSNTKSVIYHAQRAAWRRLRYSHQL